MSIRHLDSLFIRRKTDIQSIPSRSGIEAEPAG